MAKHEITIHENRSVTKEVAPYTGTYISKETFRIENFKAKLAERCGLPAIQVQAILTGAFEAIESLEGEGLVRIHLDGFTVCGIITGSFPTADAAFNKEKNSLQMAVRLDEPIRNDLADVTPTVIADASVTKLRVDNVMDLETPKPYNLIHGQGVFRVAGFNMVLDDVGSTVYLTDRLGVTYEVVVDEVISKQLFKGHTAALLEPGEYKLVVKSRAGDAEGPLQTAFRKVKYLKVAPGPKTVTLTEATCHEGEGNRKYGRLTGTGLGPTVAGDRLSAHIVPAGDEPMDIDCTITDAAPDSTWLDYEFETGYVHAGDAVRFDYVGHGGVAGSPDQTADVGCVIE